MTYRHTRKGRGALSAVAITAGLLLTVAGCGGGDDGKSDKDGSASASATKGDGSGKKDSSQSSEGADAPLAEVKSGDVTLTITSVVRDDGGFVTVDGQVINNGGEFWVASNWRSDERELGANGASMSGASLVDSKGKKKYLVLRDTRGRCLCTKFEGGGVDAGKSTDWFAQFPAPPEDTTKVDFQVGAMPPASIEISEG
ncbi:MULTISPECIES: hypothetical protein [Streptomyces]|jgi:hypothetical protein|uniref:Secreted protein n=3 Tax=Streptomyces griseoaurantiacus TaxID=68213 RepID=F3NC67_9ACTN|nr:MULTISPECIES: hypothetical protein [Streptomyces]EGG48955.1 hypothetical protein SGM_6756 [Streptomyces griseoaurantiacus M045]MBA5219866.1 hypothetical protein [Streptomyces griseoaurantiacus]MCF0090070.1 hypothetical protein [Streptomyces sp. MH192]MCF0102261.1 hypothetical protein [Streptomyces sp. MH191]MDX3363526.1 hypothetical protein [Streptomyces sp. ME02-6978.2a]